MLRFDLSEQRGGEENSFFAAFVCGVFPHSRCLFVCVCVFVSLFVFVSLLPRAAASGFVGPVNLLLEKVESANKMLQFCFFCMTWLRVST